MVTALFIGLFLFYLTYTTIFAIKFNRTSRIFNKKQQLVHNILIWVLPFVWVVILKSLIKPVRTKKSKLGNFYESELGFMANVTNETKAD
ncbi:MAG: hypothetical protein JWN56_66 [Sphingobacteriales bacterium]|nr:hypothetical protein [Sphingobacteriales bacterium]